MSTITNHPSWLCELSREPVSEADCLACARQRLQSDCPFNPAILKALAEANAPDVGLSGLHQIGYPVLRVSGLVGCARKSWYGRTRSPMLETPSEHWSRLRGTIFHAALESMGEGHVERRLTAFLYDDQVAAFITGRIDGYNPANGVLTDYKTAIRLPSRVRPHHQRQLWLYAWLLWKNGVGLPASIRVIYIHMRAIRSFDAVTPTEQDLAELERSLLQRLHLILAAEPPAARPEESWECKFCGYAECPMLKALAGERNGKADESLQV
ncbi:MAG: PD-(D/E)XK nuclease family protein [Caldilineaceae bacterium]|nr:PD-(D/E)XK nuclease family protein [Caldilineaceae bacterium]MBP8106556.1 PD-(D/E)XK nuclease family protein [Caldilineaceae bacterium]MBP8121578.1 PD-(D/E)XK nuclease family protein [Caldilineaceae bacterium]MBP9071387.1 PD-(D/E)XK nuclease family protein [Caldilineaceae bacterium]